MAKMIAIALLTSCCVAVAAVAADDGSDPGKGLEVFGYKVEKKISDKSCDVSASLSQAKMLENFELLQKVGIFNTELPKSYPREKPNSISLTFMAEAAPVTTKEVYEQNANVDRCHFTQKMTVIDDYGNEQTFTAFSYDFNRSLYKKINWEKFQPMKITKVFPNFHESPEMNRRVTEEVR